MQIHSSILTTLSADSSSFVSLLPRDCCDLISTYATRRMIRKIVLPETATKIVPIGRSLLGCDLYYESSAKETTLSTLNVKNGSPLKICTVPGVPSGLFLTDNALFASTLPQGQFLVIKEDGTHTRCERLSCKVSETASIVWNGHLIECLKTDGSAGWKTANFMRKSYPYNHQISQLFISKKYGILAYSLHLTNRICVIDIKDGSMISCIKVSHTEELRSFCMDDNGMIAALTSDVTADVPTYKPIKLFDRLGRRITEFGTIMGGPLSVAILPEGTVAVLERGKLSVWG